MAGIDKTYTDSYSEYIEFKEWADKQVITFFNGHKKCIGDWVYQYDKEHFDGCDLPIMNTPTWIDIYLINNCKIPFVLDRMKYVYGSSFDKVKNMSIMTSIPDGLKQNRKIVITRHKHTQYPIHEKAFDGFSWSLSCDDNNYWYNSETKTWADHDTYPGNSTTSYSGSLKALVRLLRKQYLPSDITFTLSGRYPGEKYTVKVK
jgi:hypothetical protein